MDHSYFSSPGNSSVSHSNTSSPASTIMSNKSCSSSKPLTERQQMALLLQMTSEESSVSTPSRRTRNDLQSPSPAQRSVNKRNERGETPLHVAAIKGDVQKVRILVSQGADVNTTDYAGWSPLHEAANRGHVSVARELLKSGAKVNMTGLDSVTALHDAAVNGHESMISLLLRYGADPSLKTATNKTALDLAVSPQVVRLLARHQSDSEEGITDENSPESVNHHNQIDNSWKTQKQQNPKSRRSLHLDCFPCLSTHVIRPDVMESNNSNTSTSTVTATVEETKDTKTSVTDGETIAVATTSTSAVEATKMEEVASKEVESSNTEIPTGQKRALESTEEEDEDTKKKRRKDETKESKQKPGGSGKTKDRKSPNTVQTETQPTNDSDEDKKEPKVPPLKIVLSNSANEVDTSVRSKSGNGRSSMAYVVSANDDKNENSNGSSDKSDDSKSSSKDATEGEKTGSSSNGGRVTRSSQRAAASAAHSTPTSGQNSANQSPTSSPTQNPSNQTPSPDPGEAANCDGQQASATAVTSAAASAPTTTVKIDDQKSGEDPVVEHPRKRKLRPREPEPAAASTPEATTSTVAPTATLPPTSSTNATAQQQQPQQAAVATQEGAVTAGPSVPPPNLPVSNCYDMYFSIRKQIERRHRNLLPVQPKPPQGFKDYLMNRCTYVIAGNAASRLSVPVVSPPPSLLPPMRDLFADQEKERYRLRMQHLIEKEKLVLSVEQEILRVHGRAARALANQALPFSVCTLLKDQEVYSALTPEQEEKDRNARSRYNGRLFLSWLQDVDDKWEKIKESMLLRHHNEAESLHAVQRMDWEWKVKEMGLCEPQNKSVVVVDELHVPMVNVSDDFDFNYNAN